MKKIGSLFIFSICWLLTANAQSPIIQNAAIAKDVQVDVTVTDFKDNTLPHEIMIFRSKLNLREYQGLTDDDGKFSVRLPAGDKYEIYILGFKDSTTYDVMDVPDPGPNASYKKPFTLSFQFQPSKTFILEDCNFETGKATLEPESYAVIDELLAYLTRKAEERIEIGGHTDNVGSAAANLVLSKDRATSVMNYLVSKGVDPLRLEAKGYGMSMPVESNKTEEGRAQNRRTEVKVLE
jgi:outer membrane protein OmpA-like peptidoglycan-associated protein